MITGYHHCKHWPPPPASGIHLVTTWSYPTICITSKIIQLCLLVPQLLMWTDRALLLARTWTQIYLAIILKSSLSTMDTPTFEPYHHSNLSHTSNSPTSLHISFLNTVIISASTPQFLWFRWLLFSSKSSIVASMFVLKTSKFMSLINLPHPPLVSKLFLMAQLGCRCSLARFGSRSMPAIWSYWLSSSLLKTPGQFLSVASMQQSLTLIIAKRSGNHASILTMEFFITMSQSQDLNHTQNCKLSLQSDATLCLLHSTATTSGVVSMFHARSIKYGWDSSGQECTHTSLVCANLAQVVHLQTQPTANPASRFIIFQLKRHLSFYTLMVIRHELPLVLKGPPAI